MSTLARHRNQILWTSAGIGDDRRVVLWPVTLTRGGKVNYRALVSALAPNFDFGDWFLIPDEATGFSGKSGPRPWLLREPLDRTRPRVRLLPRSSSGYEGVTHEAHAQRPPHGPCGVNEDGRIARVYARTLSSHEVTDERHSCREPDLDALRRMMT